MKSGYKLQKLSDVFTIISGGTPKRNISSYWNGVIPWISIQDFREDSRFIKFTEESISEEGLNNSSTNILEEKDIIISARGTVGKVNILGTTMAFNQSCYGLRTKETIDYLFAYYSLINSMRELKSKSYGSVFSTITKRTFDEVEIKVFDHSYQLKISNLLGVLDQKIETNNAIIANLEAQAQAIFKSWFIDFEPFQDGEFVESELGMIPEGWEVDKLGNSILGKLISSGISNFENEKVYLATSDVTDSNITNYENKVTFEDRPSRANMQPLKNSVWFAKMKESRKLIYVGNNDNFLINETIFSTGFAGIESNEIGINYLWTYLLTEDFDNKKNLLSNGTTMQAINNANINRIKILIPEEEVLEKFNELVKPMYEIISIYKNQNITLAQLRDTLLPKLMSGEIRVGQEATEGLENIEEIDVKENL